MKKLNALVPRELHKRVREAAYASDLSIDRYIEAALNNHFRTEMSGKKEYSGDVSQQFNPADLPDGFIRDALTVYSVSLDEFIALARVTAAVARGQESLRARGVHHEKFEPVEPLPSETEGNGEDQPK